MSNENLGPAERIVQTLLAYSDHMVHNRPGMVVPDAGSVTGVRWLPVTWVEKDGRKTVLRKEKGKKPVPVGVLQPDRSVMTEDGRRVGEYRSPGIFPEVAAWMYRQVAEVWRIDNEFAARWASYAYQQDNRDLKVVMAAFMLVQSRKGDPVMEDGKMAFRDEDFREVGEAIALIARKDKKGLNPKEVLRIREVLTIPAVAGLNRELGFGRSPRNPYLGRWPSAVEHYLRHHEQNPGLMKSKVNGGWKSAMADLCRHSHFKPESPDFFQALGWKQGQSKAGHRVLAIGQDVIPAESWNGLSEEQVCERIVRERPGFKRLTGLLPKEVGLTRAVMAAAIEAGSLSDKDLVILTPTIEELGLLEVQSVRERWEKGVKAAEDRRAANIAARVKSQEAKDKLEEGADDAVKKALEEDTKQIRAYFVVDTSQSMDGAIEAAKTHVAKFLQGFPPDRVHVSVFNTVGREVRIQHATKAGVENAFRGVSATGGTDYGQGTLALSRYKPAADEDVLFVYIGDEEDNKLFDHVFNAMGFRPMAFGLIRILSETWLRQYPGRYGNGSVVRDTAARLGIPCFQIDERTFEDPYAIPRTVRTLVASTPVGVNPARQAPPRETLVDKILKTDLLKKPAWAA